MPEKAFYVCIKDSVFIDPAMGSAGFLLESFNYVAKHYSKELMRADKAEYCRAFNHTGTFPLKMTLLCHTDTIPQ